MAVQAQMCTDASGFLMFNPPEWAGGVGPMVGHHNETWLNLQRLQFQTQNQNPVETMFLNQFETTSCSHVEKLSLEIDQFILTQNERLKHVIREQRKRDVTELLKKVETQASFLLSQKDEEIANAKSHTSQLESLLVKLQTDCLTWQQIAKQNELHVISLTNTLQLLQQQQLVIDRLVEDTESCCDEQEQQCSMGKDQIMCRVCERREAGVVVLPCRHMCLCSVMIDLCPVCCMEKKTSVHRGVHRAGPGRASP